MPIVWRQQMSVGDESVDNDHKYLIKLINDFEESVHTFSHTTNLVMALKKMEEYTVMHFSREEALQQSVGFPDYEKHKKLHLYLVGKLAQQIHDIENQSSIPFNNENNIKTFIKFIRSWLIDHVIIEDLQMKPYIKNHYL